MNREEKINNALGFGFIAIIFLVVGSLALFVVDLAYHHYEGSHQKKELRQHPPKIPVCDKELWERIKDGCDEFTP
jgi:hypothetical protein